MGGPHGPAPTLGDVARHIGVSPMSVSRALRDEPGISAATKAKVLRAVEDLGYRRNTFARSLKLGTSTGLVGFVVTNLANPFYSRMAVGVEETLAPAGLRVLLGNTGGDPTRERQLVEELLERRVDGIVLVPAGTSHQQLRPAQTLDTPVIFAARPPVSIDADCVLVDDFGGAFRATTRLIEQGHSRIGFVGHPPTVYTGAERFRGFTAAMVAAGLKVTRSLIARNTTDARSAEEACRRIMANAKPPTAFFAANNRNSLGILKATNSTSVALAGFDDLEYRDLLDRDLTLVTYSPDEIGRRAGELLLRRRETPDFGELPPMRVTVPVDIE